LQLSNPAFSAALPPRPVRAWLGAPTAVGIAVESSGARYEEWAYYHGAGNLPDMGNARVKILQIKFDQRGLVHAYNWSGESKQP
jgi:hypothetical protein